MKLIFIFILTVLWFFGCENNRRPHYVLHEMELVAVPEFYRKIIGYDSLQFIYSLHKWNVNFCYPNKWEFEKFKNFRGIDSITIEGAIQVPVIYIDDFKRNKK